MLGKEAMQKHALTRKRVLTHTLSGTQQHTAMIGGGFAG
ncbi:hypothetical protein NBRC3222_2673 [Acetobacter pasteurianus NBRC 3222]|nr:hypothetical protein NBRC3222_2673 [Acetobacter pasteurianus NBRC 3222]